MSVNTTKPRRLLCRPWEVRAYLSGAKTQFRVPIKPQPSPETGGMWYCVSSTERSSVGTWTPRQIGKEYRAGENNPQTGESVKCPFGTVGSRLWLAETWADVNTENGPAFTYADHTLKFCVDDAYPVEYVRYPGCEFTMWCSDLWNRDARKCRDDHRWRSAATMPQWASRLMLEVKSVRVQRLQDISEEDAIAEGLKVQMGDGSGPGSGFKWNGPGYWGGSRAKKSGYRSYHVQDGMACCCDVREKSAAVCAYRELWDSTHGPGSYSSNPWLWAVEVEVVSA